jgi:dolichol-phosphate mannosyltransferase
MSITANPVLSVVIPMYNEEEVLPQLIDRLRPLLDGDDTSYEVVAVDDGSTDATLALLTAARRTWPELRVISLRRNSGHQAALTAGLHHAFGDYVASIDADLQDPPEVILQMLDLARQDQLDIVYGVRSDRSSDTVLKRSTAAVYYRIMRRLCGNTVRSHAGDFRLLSRATVEVLKELPEHQPVYRLLVPWVGFPSAEVTYVREKRAAGHTKYPLSKMIRLALDSVTNFSAAPLRMSTWLGGLGLGLCLTLMLGTAGSYFLGIAVPGWTSIILAILFIGAVQLVCLGLLGEYVGRIYSAVQGRPGYFIASDSAVGQEFNPADAVPSTRAFAQVNR